jgi:hypothetical protein
MRACAAHDVTRAILCHVLRFRHDMLLASLCLQPTLVWYVTIHRDARAIEGTLHKAIRRAARCLVREVWRVREENVFHKSG